MAFKKDYIKRGLSLPGMIDIIFLLLIFSLVTLSSSNPDVSQYKEGEQSVQIDLPIINSNLTEKRDNILHRPRGRPQARGTGALAEGRWGVGGPHRSDDGGERLA
ncbi:MAG: hypothetical protein P8078_05070, partial [bacterium]